MDATITYDEVIALVGSNILSLEPRPNFECIRVLRRHFECALQCLPCPQSTQLGWKDLVMARAMYALLTNVPFRVPTNPGDAANYSCPIMPGQPPDLTSFDRDQADIDRHQFCSTQALFSVVTERWTWVFQLAWCISQWRIQSVKQPNYPRMACRHVHAWDLGSVVRDLWPAGSGRNGAKQHNFLRPILRRRCPQSSLLVHQELRQDCDHGQQPIHQSSTD